MKKVLYGTTALIAAGMFASAAEAATPLKLSVGGYLNAFIGYTDLEVIDPVTGAQTNNKFDVATDGQIVFSGETKLDNGIKVGAVAEVNLSSYYKDLNNNASWLGDVYATIESKYGKAIIGATDNVSVMMHNVAPDASGVFGVDKTKLANFLGLENVMGVSLLRIDSTAIDFYGNAQKISYITPKFYGFNVGVSYVPGADMIGAFQYSGAGALDNSVSRPATGNNFTSAYAAAIAYAGKFGGLEMGADVAYGYGNLPASYLFTAESAREISVGLNVGYAGFTLGAGFKDQDLKKTVYDNANAWDVGIGYENGPYAVSASYFRTKNGKDKTTGAKMGKLDIWQVSGKYKLGAGVDAFATFGYFDANAKIFGAAKPEDKVWTIVTGLALKF